MLSLAEAPALTLLEAALTSLDDDSWLADETLLLLDELTELDADCEELADSDAA